MLLPRLTDVVLTSMFEAIDAAAITAGYQVLVAAPVMTHWRSVAE